MKISIIVPVLNEAAGLAGFLAPLQSWRRQGHQLILVDGGSCDATVALAAGLCDRVLSGPRGRARQMNLGAAAAEGELLLFLHADTRLPADAAASLVALFADPSVKWSRFDVRLSGSGMALRLVAWSMNLRSRWTRVATGDQGIAVRQEVFARVGGYAEIPLMEDVELSKRLRRLGQPGRPSGRITVSSRRWEARGIGRTILLMWWLRLLYWLGDSPEYLARIYYKKI